MAGRHESSIGSFGTIVGVLAGIAVLVGGVMVKVPPYVANREVEQALVDTAHELDPTKTDDEIINAINVHLADIKTSRYWVENNRQATALDLTLDFDHVAIHRDGTRSMTIDATYTQTMWVPLLGRADVQTFHAHADSLSK